MREARDAGTSSSNGHELALVRELHADVARFYVRDRRLVRAQEAFGKALAANASPGAAEMQAYVSAVARYFEGFAGEAGARLRDVEKRLGRVAQLQFNLTAERGVAAERVHATQGVLARLRKIGGG